MFVWKMRLFKTLQKTSPSIGYLTSSRFLCKIVLSFKTSFSRINETANWWKSLPTTVLQKFKGCKETSCSFRYFLPNNCPYWPYWTKGWFNTDEICPKWTKGWSEIGKLHFPNTHGKPITTLNSMPKINGTLFYHCGRERNYE